MCNSKRIITKEQERAYRLVHHDFCGLSRQEAADIMEISVYKLNKLLNGMRKLAPRLFPIVNKFNYELLLMQTDEGLTYEEIVKRTGLTFWQVAGRIQRVKKKLGIRINLHPKIVPFDRVDETKIKQVF